MLYTPTLLALGLLESARHPAPRPRARNETPARRWLAVLRDRHSISTRAFRRWEAEMAS